MDDNEFNLEKLKLSHSREKFWIGGVALVLATTLVNWQIQWKQVEIKQIEEENRHLSQFVQHILDRDPTTRLYISEYFEKLSYSTKARGRWASYKEIAKTRIEDEKQAERRRAQLQVRLEEILDEIADPNTPDSLKKTLQEDLLVAKIDISDTQKLLAALNPTIKKEKAAASAFLSGGIIGRDDRIRVVGTSSVPWNAICNIIFVGTDVPPRLLTGFLIHPRLVLTAGHPFASSGPATVEVACGKDEAIFPYGKVSSKKVHVSPFNLERHNVPALSGIVLSRPLNQNIAWKLNPLNDEELLNLTVETSGYPMDRTPGTQWRNAGKIIGVDKQTIYYDLDTGFGMSGAPIFTSIRGELSVVGVHQLSNPKSGSRITHRIINLINGWIAELE